MKKLVVLSFVVVSLLVASCSGRTGTGTGTGSDGGMGGDTVQQNSQSDTTRQK